MTRRRTLRPAAVSTARPSYGPGSDEAPVRTWVPPIPAKRISSKPLTCKTSRPCRAWRRPSSRLRSPERARCLWSTANRRLGKRPPRLQDQAPGLRARPALLWELGAYGEDSDARAELVRLCLQRANTPAKDAVLIGDTPADIEGAQANNVRVIAVASGRSNEFTLRDAGAQAVLSDLRDTELLVKLICGDNPH
ncbi:HAD family hydrolase [Streptomyces mirabilis]|uniref:HAD family hydrolase n=1 Tax=Streptomyces mirabilis TaxID=68239 RepID=UPI0036A9A536